MSKNIEYLRNEIACRLVLIEDFLEESGCPMPNITIICRDPNNDEMFICISSEDDSGLLKATELALNAREQ